MGVVGEDAVAGDEKGDGSIAEDWVPSFLPFCVQAALQQSFAPNVGRYVAPFMGSRPPRCRVLDVVDGTDTRLW